MTAEPLEQFITEAVLSTIEGGALAKSLAGTEDSDSNGLAGKLRADELRLEELARDHYVDATIGRAEFLAARQALVTRIDAQRAKLAEASNRSVLVRLPDASDSLRQAWAEGDVDWRRTVIAAVLDHAAINPGRPGSRKFDTDRVALSWRV